MLIVPQLSLDVLEGTDILSTNPRTKSIIHSLQEELAPKAEYVLQQDQAAMFIQQVNCNDSVDPHEQSSTFEFNYSDFMDRVNSMIKEVSADNMKELTTTNLIKHTNRLEPGAEPIKQKIRKVPLNYMHEFEST